MVDGKQAPLANISLQFTPFYDSHPHAEIFPSPAPCLLQKSPPPQLPASSSPSLILSCKPESVQCTSITGLHVTNNAVCSTQRIAVFSVPAITNNQSPFCPLKAPASSAVEHSPGISFLTLLHSTFQSSMYVCNICELHSNAMQCNQLHCTYIFVCTSLLCHDIVCTVTCHECTDDAPAVDTLTDLTLICNVTKTRVTASAYRNTWHQLFKGKRLSKTDLLMKKEWDQPSQMTNTSKVWGLFYTSNSDGDGISSVHCQRDLCHFNRCPSSSYLSVARPIRQDPLCASASA